MYHQMLYGFSIVTYVLLFRALSSHCHEDIPSSPSPSSLFPSLLSYLVFSLLLSFFFSSLVFTICTAALCLVQPLPFLPSFIPFSPSLSSHPYNSSFSCTPHILIHTCLFIFHTHSCVTSSFSTCASLLHTVAN